MARTDEQDTSRREFFRTFGRETVRQAGAVAGAAAELRRSSEAAARVLFDPEAATTDLPADPIDQSQPDATFRSAYRFTGTDIVALDARLLPDRIVTVSLVQPSEVASAIRGGTINGGPVLAEVGAYAMALAAQGVVARPETGRVQQVRAAANALRAAKPQIHALTWAVDRLEALYLELTGQGADPTQAAESLRSEADSIASANAVAHAQIGRVGAGVLLATSNQPLNLLVHGDMGPLSCGMVGMGTALLADLRDRGRDVHVWATEAAPSGEGGHVTAFTLRQLDVPHTVIPDAAVGWLLYGQRIDSVLLRGDSVAENGDCLVLMGGLTTAVVATEASVPVHVLAPRNAFAAAPTGLELQGDASPVPSSEVVVSQYTSRVLSESSH